MTTTIIDFSLPECAPGSADLVFRLMQKLQHGSLEVQLPDGSHTHFGSPHSPHGIKANIRLKNWNVCSAVLKSGDIGFAEAFMAGDWATSDLVSLLKLLIANRDSMERLIYGTWWGALLYRAKHFFNRNSRRGSQKNIHAHYDIGNNFYQLWLDSTMNYSSAWFEGDYSQTLSQAQKKKIHRALQECNVKAGDRVLEIGCGWGALAESATQEFGAFVYGITLSKEQLNWAQKRLADQNLVAEIKHQDYRDIQTEPFDAIVSIEMFEAVGREFWPEFFKTIRRQLKAGGRACIQSITIRDDLFERYVRSSDFIQQYIFPGGLLPSQAEFRKAAQAAGLNVVREFSFGPDYAETLRRWREEFLSRSLQVLELGFDTRFLRIWEFYLAYCEAAFAMGNTDVVQFTLEA